MKSKTFTLILSIFCSLLTFTHFSALATDGDVIHFLVEKNSVEMGDPVCLSIKVTNFEDIIGGQASIQFNPFQLQFDSITATAPELNLNENAFGLTTANEGTIRFNFFDAGTPLVLEDSTSIFSICFTSIGAPGNFAPVKLGDFPIPMEIIESEDGEFVYAEFAVENGGADILSPQTLEYTVSACTADSTESNGHLSFSFFGDTTQFPLELEYHHLTDSQVVGQQQIPFGSTEVTIDQLPAGELVYTLSNIGGIISTDTVTIHSFGPVNAFFSSQNPSCHDSDDGTATFTGLDLDQHILDSIFFFSSWENETLFENTLENLENGIYVHYLTDQGGCVYTDSIELFTSEIEVSYTLTQNDCPGDTTGIISASATGGTPFSGNTYQYTWENGQSQTTINALRQNLESGTYVLTTTDRNGCSKENTFEIIDEFEVTIQSISIQPVGCDGEEAGSASFEIGYAHIADLPGFVTHLNDTTATLTIDSNLVWINDLTGGDYTLSITDTLSGMCQAEYHFTILEADTALSVHLLNTTDETCPGDENGTIEVEAVGGLPDGDGNYQYEWSNGQETALIDGLAPGVYSLTVTDDIGCQEFLEVEIGTTTPPVITLTDSISPACFGSADGSIFIEVTEGSGGAADLIWDHGAEGTELSELEAGTYRVVATDSLGCSDELEITLFEPDSIEITAEVVDESHAGEMDGSIALDVQGGTGTYTYDWDSGQSEAALENLSGGTYCVTVEDENGCQSTACFEVEVLTSVHDLKDLIGVDAYPNPASSYLTVSIEQTSYQLKKIELISINGQSFQLNREESGSAIGIDLDPFVAGQYFLRLTFDEGFIVKPITIVK